MDVLGDMQRFSEEEISETTGCLPPCTRSEYVLTTGPKVAASKRLTDARNFTYAFVLVFGTGRYELKEQFRVYDGDSFVADVGGYMGLLLGHSVVSIYRFALQWAKISWRKLSACKLFNPYNKE